MVKTCSRDGHRRKLNRLALHWSLYHVFTVQSATLIIRSLAKPIISFTLPRFQVPLESLNSFGVDCPILDPNRVVHNKLEIKINGILISDSLDWIEFDEAIFYRIDIILLYFLCSKEKLLTFMMKCSDGVRIGPLSLVLEVGRHPFGIVDVIMIQVKNQFWYLVFRALFRGGERFKSQSSQ